MTSPQPDPPAYVSEDNQTSVQHEKEGFKRQRCAHGSASQTPHIDAELQKPNARAALLALSAAFAAAAEEDRCLKCTVQSVAPELSVCFGDMKRANKNGSISKEDKKQLKSEMKWLFKGMKKDMKKSWKEDA